jgi:hypothetical protein
VAQLQNGDRLRLGDPEGPGVLVELEPEVVGELREPTQEPMPRCADDALLAQMLGCVDARGIAFVLARLALDTFAESETAQVLGIARDEPVLAIGRSTNGGGAMAWSPPLPRLIVDRARSSGAIIVFGGDVADGAETLSGACFPLEDEQGQVAGVLAVQGARPWKPHDDGVHAVARAARFAGRLIAPALAAGNGHAPAPHDGTATAAEPSAEADAAPLIPLSDARDRFLKTYIERALRISHGNRRAAARLLGTDPSNLGRTMKRLGLRARDVIAATGVAPIDDVRYSAPSA